MADIAEFLLARLSDDEYYLQEIIRMGEAKANSLGPNDMADVMSFAMTFATDELMGLIDRWMKTGIKTPNDVHRLLQEIELKRRIVQRYIQQAARQFESAMEEDRAWMLESVLFDLAQIYDQHPDFKEKWRS